MAALAGLAGLAAAWFTHARAHRPWGLPIVAVLSVPVVGSALVYPAAFALTVRRRDVAVWAYLVVGALAIAVPSVAPGGAVRLGLDGRVLILYDAETRTAAHLLLLLAVALVGTTIGARRDLLAGLRDRAERAETERHLRVHEAVLLERARIAREMHDVLGHAITLVTMQAGALEVNADAGPDDVEAQAAQIRSTAREALRQLRVVVGALDDPTVPPPLAPDAGVAGLSSMIDRYRAAGAAVHVIDTLSGRGDLDSLDPAVGRAVVRLLAEALTNAHRHAPGRPVTICLEGDPEQGVDISVQNPRGQAMSDAHLGGETNGTGLAGLSERVRLAGGSLAWGPRRSVFEVRARLPWHGPAPTSDERVSTATTSRVKGARP